MKAAQLESKTRDGVIVDSVRNVIVVADGTSVWDGYNLVASASVGPGEDYEGGVFKVTPRIDSISPTSGPAVGGTAVTITGRRLGGSDPAHGFGTLIVKFGANEGTNVRTRLYAHATVDTPAGSVGTVDVTVINQWGQSVLAAAFTYT